MQLTQRLSERNAKTRRFSKVKLLIFQIIILPMVTPNYLVTKKLEVDFILSDFKNYCPGTVANIDIYIFLHNHIRIFLEGAVSI